MNPQRVCFADDGIVAVGVAVCLVPPDGAHAAVAHRGSDGNFRLLHLMGHENVGSTPFKNSYLLISPNLRPSSQIALAGYCRRIAERRNFLNLKYDFGIDVYAKFVISDDECDLKTNEPQSGLTCATFVFAVFNSINRPLIDITNYLQKSNQSELVLKKSLVRH